MDPAETYQVSYMPCQLMPSRPTGNNINLCTKMTGKHSYKGEVLTTPPFFTKVIESCTCFARQAASLPAQGNAVSRSLREVIDRKRQTCSWMMNHHNCQGKPCSPPSVDKARQQALVSDPCWHTEDHPKGFRQIMLPPCLCLLSGCQWVQTSHLQRRFISRSHCLQMLKALAMAFIVQAQAHKCIVVNSRH